MRMGVGGVEVWRRFKGAGNYAVFPGAVGAVQKLMSNI